MSFKNTKGDRLFNRDIPEYKYVVTAPERTHISVSKNLKVVLEIYQQYQNIRTLTEAIYRACALGIRYDLMRRHPLSQAEREIHQRVLNHIREKFNIPR